MEHPLSITRYVDVGPSITIRSVITLQTRHAAGVMGVLTQFGLGELAGALQVVDGINEVWNLLSIEPNVHFFFECFDLWFEGTGEVCHLETFCLPRLTACSQTATLFAIPTMVL